MKQLQPATLHGTATILGSKSITHRAYILAALSGTLTEILHPLQSDDTHITADCLRQLGYSVIEQQDRTIINREPRRIPTTMTMNVGMSGTTARLMAGLAAIQTSPVSIDGAPRMRERPMKDLLVAIEELGGNIQHSNYLLPATITRPIQTSLAHLRADISSQFLSSLLLIAPYTPKGIEIRIQGEITSRSYSDMTIAMMEQCGVVVGHTPDGYRVSQNQSYIVPARMTVERDFSSASYFVAGAAITQGDVFLQYAQTPSLQGDSAILEIAQSFGAEITHEQTGIRVRGRACNSIDVDMNTCPDIVPTVAVMAMFGNAPSRLRHVGHLRYKESDRITATLSNMHRLGGEGYMDGEDMIIIPKPPETLHGASINVFDDHRIAMCFAVAGLRIAGVQIEHEEVVAKSFPNFWECWEAVCVQSNQA
jgi:3-phosphoshikimate 1-carboxyvinyltransferase